MFNQFIVVITLVVLIVVNGFHLPITNNKWISKININSNQIYTNNIINKYNTRMSMTTEESKTVDFSKYTVGQEYEGTPMSAKAFGIFVDISTGINVLLPRSLLSRGSFEKLKSMVDNKSTEKIKIELVGVSAEDKTLSGKYLPPNLKERADISTLKDKDLTGQKLKATVVGAHNFGLFAELEDYGVEGLVPVSKLPSKIAADQVENAYPVGSTIEVEIETINVEDNKLVLTMRDRDIKSDASAFSDVPTDQWMEAVVEKVAAFGMFVRPVGFDASGLVHVSQIPRPLMAALRKRDNSEGSSEATVETLFGAGDIVKVRVQAVQEGSNRVGLTMQRYRASAEAEDDYIPEGRDPEGEEDKFKNSFEDSEDNYDPEDTLIWWRGSNYVKSSLLPDPDVDEELEVLNESTKIVEGTWRRMFELDLRQDQADFTSKLVESEMKELADEIGELDGLDMDLSEGARIGGSPYGTNKVGAFISNNIFPSDWKNEVQFFSELEATESDHMKKLRGGKAGDNSELEALLKEIDTEMKAGGGKSAPVADNVIPAVITTAAAEETADTENSATNDGGNDEGDSSADSA